MANLPSTWKTLETVEQLDDIINNSVDKPKLIFKHSVHCSTSTLIKMKLTAEWDIDPDTIDFYQLDIINHNDVSSAIETKLGVQHQSPQIIMVKNKKATNRTSHLDISYEFIKKAIEDNL